MILGLTQLAQVSQLGKFRLVHTSETINVVNRRTLISGPCERLGDGFAFAMFLGLTSVSMGTRGGGGREWLIISGETALSFRSSPGVDGSIGDDVDDIGDDLGPDNNDGACRFGTICWNIESCVVGGGGGVGDNGII
ncbi:hypothetical protein V6N11_049805 [Hibiscus sabdariffa]|uniref:Uncharacterized protein n=2 Tax=Hibiscus sabdariffa TaxID=183260 RepID=A0ABR1ZZK1_9ROSI